ncbi:MAG: hypothetical protein ACE5E4_05870 [Candidatus Binatia bacterium]
MKPGAPVVLFAALLVLGPAARVFAAVVANGPDDICAPTADPCVIDQVYEVAAPGDLDFGLRAVSITSGGELLGTVNLSCGKFSSDRGGNGFAVKTAGGSGAGSFTVTAWRACSGDGVTPCLTDASCANLALGDCSLGDGSVDLDGKLNSRGSPGGVITIRAAGDIVTRQVIDVGGADRGAEGGSIEMESFKGSVRTEGKLKARAGRPWDYYGTPDSAGTVTLRAAVDVTVVAAIHARGGNGGGALDLLAGRDVVVGHNVDCSAGRLAYATGGSIFANAGRDLVVSGSGATGRGATTLRTNGSGTVDGYGYGNSGYGGEMNLYADGDVRFSEKSALKAYSGKWGCGETMGGFFYIEAGGELHLDGAIRANGRGPCGEGGYLKLTGQGGVFTGPSSLISIVSKNSGAVNIYPYAYSRLDGKLDARGLLKKGGEYAYYSYYGYGGGLYVSGEADVRIGGQLLTGGDAGTLPIEVSVCRLTLSSSAKLDSTHGGYNGYGDGADISIRVGESMKAEAGSRILNLADLGYGVGYDVDIRYRDPAKPPVLLGKVKPEATLILDPSIKGCPVCGNLEIDKGESCDDGNLSSGDGCRDDCQDEGCLLQSPGFPAIALCDDGDACTLDSCDPVNHACINLASCEEGVSCTVDVCVAGACEHTPSDALCDDGDDCTDDLCNLSTGCVYADLSGNACEDGDRCTLTGSCNAGVCEASDQRLSSSNKLAARFRDGPGNDRLNFKGSLPLADFNSLPTATGLSIEVLDASGAVVFSSSIPAADFEDLGGDGLRFRFRDNRFEVPSANGVVNVSLKLIAAKGIAKLKIKVKERELSGLEGQGTASVSLLWGADPALDDCLTAWRMPCTAKATRTFCKL